MRPRLCSAIVATALVAGCSSSNGRIEPPGYSSDAGEAAIAAYDGNRDGAIAGAELNRVGGLKASLPQVDLNRDGRITANEIDARVQSWRDSKVGEMPVSCRVTLDGAPLANATIVLEPESFLGPNVHPATGTTTADGIAGLSLAKELLADPRYAGVACGWYKIRVTCNGREIPARYNTETILGCEVAMDAHWVSDSEVKVALKSKLD